MKILVILATVGLVVGCSPQQSATTANTTEDATEPLLLSNSCDAMDLFITQGLAQDLRATVDPKFFPNGYEIVIPKALRAFDGYGGDIVETVLGVRTTVARVWDVHPGGPSSAVVGGAKSGDKFSRQGLEAARALFNAMTKAVETSTTDSGWTTTTRVSTAGRFRCDLRTNAGALQDASCTFDNLLFSQPRSFVFATPADFCASR